MLIYGNLTCFASFEDTCMIFRLIYSAYRESKCIRIKINGYYLKTVSRLSPWVIILRIAGYFLQSLALELMFCYNKNRTSVLLLNYQAEHMFILVLYRIF